MYRLLLSILLLPLFSFAQINKDYQGLLWKISGNGLEEPSYLYGTMHVSNRVAFHLSETFFDALDNADIIALETNPETWVEELTSSQLYHDFFEMSYRYAGSRNPLYSSFVPYEPQQQDWEYYLSRDQDMLNSLLYRLDQSEQDFAENTYLDLFIFQAGKKGGKSIVSLEDYEESFQQVMRSNKQDKDAVRITSRQAQDLLGDFTDWQTLMEDGYRRGDLDLLDTLNTVLYPGKYYRKWMLDVRNEIMATGMDSLMQEGVVFTGVGAAHLPGNKGVINLLRKMGYTVEAEERAVTETSISRKEDIDNIIYKTALQDFESDDDFISTKVPGKMVKFISQPYQEYVFADMANGGFYSIRRINTFSAMHGKSARFYQGRLDSMLYENIPGKILSKDSIQVSGFPAMDIRNETKTGDLQHYQMVFTPLEVIIFKVGGHKEFAKSELPEKFFSSINLQSNRSDAKYQPQFKGFEVELPGNLLTEQYEGAFENPAYTFWAQSYDDGDYYAAGLRQFHDFEYLEEDDFELKIMVDKFTEDEKFEIDTVYLVEGEKQNYSRFIIENKKQQKLYGEIHIQGPKYVFLLTNSEDPAKQERFFKSFSFKPWHYEQEFKEYQDTAYHISMRSPMEINNFQSFLDDLYGNYGYTSEEDNSHQGELNEKTIYFPETGEQILISLETLHKYESYENLEEFWEDQKNSYDYYAAYEAGADQDNNQLHWLRDSLLYSSSDSNYLTEARIITYSGYKTHRIIKKKLIVENGAIYGLTVYSDSLGYFSAFADTALLSFRPSMDTLFGLPITTPKADLFFEALKSGDSLNIAQASNSVYMVDFAEKDAEQLLDLINNFKAEGFDRDARLGLVNQYARLKMDDNLDFLEELYYKNRDSSAYQFEILEALAGMDTKESVKRFKKLILDEPPFGSNTFAYYTMFNQFRDSLNLAVELYPDLLSLTDFEDYRMRIYSLLSELLDTGMVKGKDYKVKYKTLLLFAKVELKKQHASDDSKGYYGSRNTSNTDLLTYTKLLTPYARKKEVQEHFQKVMSIRNENILAGMAVVIDPYWEVPDSVWNDLAEEPKAFAQVIPYLKESGKMSKLDAEYQSREHLAKSLLMKNLYSEKDTLAFIRSEKLNIKAGPSEAFFFKAQDDDEKLWTLYYVVVKDQEELGEKVITAKVGETFNEDYDDLDEIIEDAIKSIKLYQRDRAYK